MPKPKPVAVEELQRAILRAIVREFDGRPLDRDTAVQALALAAFELNMVEIREAVAAAGRHDSPRYPKAADLAGGPARNPKSTSRAATNRGSKVW
jgi:hypothetical protein